MTKYWTSKENQLIADFYYCYTASTSAETRQRIYNQLYPALLQLTRQALYSTGKQKYSEDDVQECLSYIHTKLLPRLTQEKLIGSLNYLWISIKRYIITYLIKKKKSIKFDGSDYNNYYNRDNRDDSYNADYNQEMEDTRIEILWALDDKIKKQKVVNKTNTILLILMKEYIIKNDFDVRDFETYIEKKMNITKTTYRAIMSRLGIRSKIFNEKLNKGDRGSK